MSERLLKTLRKFADFQAEYAPAAISNGYRQRMSVSVVASPRNQPKIFGRKRTFYLECQPRNNPDYVRNERKYPWSYEAKTLDYSAQCGAITGFGSAPD